MRGQSCIDGNADEEVSLRRRLEIAAVRIAHDYRAGVTWLIKNYFNSRPYAMHLLGFQFHVIERAKPALSNSLRSRSMQGAPRHRLGVEGHRAGMARRERQNRSRFQDAISRWPDLHGPLPQSRA